MNLILSQAGLTTQCRKSKPRRRLSARGFFRRTVHEEIRNAEDRSFLQRFKSETAIKCDVLWPVCFQITKLVGEVQMFAIVFHQPVADAPALRFRVNAHRTEMRMRF